MSSTDNNINEINKPLNLCLLSSEVEELKKSLATMKEHNKRTLSTLLREQNEQQNKELSEKINSLEKSHEKQKEKLDILEKENTFLKNQVFILSSKLEEQQHNNKNNNLLTSSSTFTSMSSHPHTTETRQQEQHGTASLEPTAFPPKTLLSSWYGKHHKITIPNTECYETWNNGAEAHLLQWTSVFTCPISKEKFASGSFGNPETYNDKKKVNHQNTTTVIIGNSSDGALAQQKSRQSCDNVVTEKNNCGPTDNKSKDDDNNIKEKDIFVIDIDVGNNGRKAKEDDEYHADVVWFNRKISAEHAAAARALDCLNYREKRYFNMLSSSSSCEPTSNRLCKEKPTDAPDIVVESQIGHEVILKQKRDQLITQMQVQAQVHRPKRMMTPSQDYHTTQQRIKKSREIEYDNSTSGR